uniref:BSD domain-containing protein n=1 Tax=Ascaris lumbricoides TaxID=6252 RepID=A0A0M3HX89_ASCLU
MDCFHVNCQRALPRRPQLLPATSLEEDESHPKDEDAPFVEGRFWMLRAVALRGIVPGSLKNP